MSQNDYHNISAFINGTLKNIEREEVLKQIKNHSTKVESNKMKTDNKKTFDPDKAWSSFYKKIESNGLLNQKIRPLFSARNIAASIVLLIGITLFGYFIVNNFGNSQFTKINSTDSIKEVVLPDGSRISLNHDSSVKFPKEFPASDRTVEFSGEAFFDITKNSKKPFIIKSNNAEITVLGTSFNVLAYKKNNITVTVKTGKVKLAKNKTENIVLNPNETGEINNNKLGKSTNSDKNYLAWKTKCFTYNGEQLSKVVDDINKVYGANIVFENENTGKNLFNSDIKNKSLNSALKLICGPDNLLYKQEGKTIIIYKNDN